jgi:hypothetical protein
MIYKDRNRNHVISPGRENELDAFLNSTYKGRSHKQKHSTNSYSEDAMTWSCFDYIRQRPRANKEIALQRIVEDSFEGENAYPNLTDGQIEISIGKQYTANTINETTEVDASIETDKYLIFFEAKLYSAMSLESPPEKPHNQIAKKLRVGISKTIENKKEFVFIIIDIAPYKKLNKRALKSTAVSGSTGFYDKWKTAWWFDYYKNGRNKSKKPLLEIVKDIKNPPDIESISKNMGWITWADLFKTVLFSSIEGQKKIV